MKKMFHEKVEDKGELLFFFFFIKRTLTVVFPIVKLTRKQGCTQIHLERRKAFVHGNNLNDVRFNNAILQIGCLSFNSRNETLVITQTKISVSEITKINIIDKIATGSFQN